MLPDVKLELLKDFKLFICCVWLLYLLISFSFGRNSVLKKIY